MTQHLKSNDRVLLKAVDARKIAGFSRQHMQRLLKSKSIEGEKLGRDWFVYEDSLRAFLDQPRKPGPKGPRKQSSQQDIQGLPDTSSIDSSQKDLADKG
jgi:hypothetical protein